MNVVVKPYDENWVQMFREEAQLIRDIFQENMIAIHHIGSTSVPDLKAKPVIDILPVVKSIEIVDSFNSQMKQFGYESLGEFGLKGRRFFRKGGDNRTHNVHFYQIDNDYEINRHLAVRDYLREHPEYAFQYGKLKEQLATQFPKDIYGYMDGKDEFVKRLEQRAMAWRERKG